MRVCICCSHLLARKIFQYENISDKYEEWCGVEKTSRRWLRCLYCGFYYQICSYDVKVFDKLYSHGYRDEKFRGESIQSIYDRISSYKQGTSENIDRSLWFNAFLQPNKKQVLDIGSGFGIWPAELKRKNYDVQCIEPNEESAKFINDVLDIPCRAEFFNGGLGNRFDVVSLVHVLEHVSEPKTFMEIIKKEVLKEDGQLFIEVPDACEFAYLPQDHDEFNSTHRWFFDISTLNRFLENAGFEIHDVRRIHYPRRNLRRIMAICGHSSYHT